MVMQVFPFFCVIIEVWSLSRTSFAVSRRECVKSTDLSYVYDRYDRDEKSHKQIYQITMERHKDQRVFLKLQLHSRLQIRLDLIRGCPRVFFEHLVRHWVRSSTRVTKRVLRRRTQGTDRIAAWKYVVRECCVVLEEGIHTVLTGRERTWQQLITVCNGSQWY
jgi:hypothetical protein